MLLKAIIILLLIAIIVSLGSGLVFLFKDTGSSKRTLNSLGVRVTLACALVLTIVYGFLSGQLEIGAPWDGRKFAQPLTPETLETQETQETQETTTDEKANSQ